MLGPWKRLVIFVLFFLSGAAGLIYEVVWAKHLSLLLGNTTQAHTIVLATFMGGLALGYFLFGKVADKSRGILRLYGWLEIAIALCGALFVSVIENLGALYIRLLGQFGTDSFAGTALKLALSMLVMLAPTVLMGGTLPVLSRLLVHTLGEVKRQVARLYFVNSLGAAAGSFLAGFVLIPHLGLNFSVLVAVALNLAAGWAALALRSGGNTDQQRASSLPGTVGSPTALYTPLGLRVAIFGIALSGGASLIYEIAWIRLLSLILGSSAYSFSLMLTAFISGIALGSFAVTHGWAKRFDPYFMFCLAELAVVVSIVLTLPLYERLPYYFHAVANVFVRAPETFWLYSATQFSVCLLLMLLPTFFLGMTLPLLSQAATQNLTAVGQDIGNIFAANTAGTLIGAYAGGLLLLPALGIKRMIELGVLMNFLVGASALGFVTQLSRKNKALILGGICGLFSAYIYLYPSWDQKIFSSGVFRDKRSFLGMTYQQFRKVFREEILYYKDGSNTTVAVTKSADGDIRLKINGKTDASSRGDLPTQILIAQLPLLVKPEASTVLVIGLGSGITAGSVLQHPVSRLDVVEISPEVVEASRFFAKPGQEPLRDPRAKLYIEDAKAFLKVRPQLYDVIISEPSNPWVAGVASLYSIEFFRDMRSRLQPDGLAVQWLHAYEMTDETLRLILRTFAASFAHVTLWSPMAADLILIGSNAPRTVNFAKFRDRFENPKVREDLGRLGIRSVPSVLSLQVASDKRVRQAAGKGAVHEDLFPRLEYEAPKAFFLGNYSELLSLYDERQGPGKGSALYLSKYLEKAELGPKELKDMTLYHFAHSRGGLASHLVEHWLRMEPDEPEARWIRARLQLQKGSLDAARSELNYLLRLRPNQREYLEAAAQVEFQTYLNQRSFLNQKTPAAALNHLRRLLELGNAETDRIYRTIAQIHAAAGDHEAAMSYLEKAAAHAKENNTALKPDVLWVEAADIAIDAADADTALAYLRQALDYNPQNGIAKARMAQVSRSAGAARQP